MFHNALQQLNNIRDISSSKEKLSCLNIYMTENNPQEFREIIRLMLDPTITFGITKFNRTEEAYNDVCTFTEFKQVMASLAERRMTGQRAADALDTLCARGVPYELIRRIINKESGAGFGATMVNKVMPGFLPSFPYMRCSRPAQRKAPLPWAEGVYVQVKYDGMFINLNVEADCITMSSRQGNLLPIEKFPRIQQEAASRLDTGYQYHGELLAYQGGVLLPRAIGNGMINGIIEGRSLEDDVEVYLHIWDAIPLHAVQPRGKYQVRYEERFKRIRKMCWTNLGYIKAAEYTTAYSEQESKAFLKKVLLMGLEGTIEKTRGMIWADGTSKDQIKHKVTAECDLEIIGYHPGKGKNAATFGSIIGKSKCGKLKAKVSGISDELRQYVQENRERLLGTIMNVKYNVITEPSPSNDSYSLFLPRLEELCKDKTEAEVLEKIQSDFQEALEAAE